MSPINNEAIKRNPLPCFDQIETPMPKKSVKGFFSAKVALLTKKWGHKGKVIFISRCAINIIAQVGEIIVNSGELIARGYSKTNQVLTDSSLVLKDSVLHLKFFLIVNIPIGLASMCSEINNIWKSIQWKDREGVLLSTILFTLTSASLFDDVTIFANATLKVFAEYSVEWITQMASPLGLAITSVSALTKCYHLYQLSKFNQEFDRKIFAIETVNTLKEKISSQELRSFLCPFLQKHLGSDLSSQKKAQAILQRHTSPEVVDLMKKIADLLDENATLSDPQITKVLGLLKLVKTAMNDEKKLQRGLLVATIIAGLAFGMLLTPAAPLATPALLGISVSMQVALKINHSKGLKQRLAIAESAC